jgi:hypothetical protein
MWKERVHDMRILTFACLAALSLAAACQSNQPPPTRATMEKTINAPLGTGNNPVCDASQNVC